MGSAFDGIARLISKMMPDVKASKELSGRVTRIDEEGVAWVRFPGASEDTPCTKRSAEVSPGQRVDVRIEKGVASITGNYSAPATDDTTAQQALSRASTAAIVGAVALGEAKDANGFINTNLSVDENGFWVGNPNSDFRILSAPGSSDGYSTPGVYIVDRNGNIVTKFGSEFDFATGEITMKVTPDKFTIGCDGNFYNSDTTELEEGYSNRLIVSKLKDYRTGTDVVNLTMKDHAKFIGDTYLAYPLFNEERYALSSLSSSVATSGSVEYTRRGPIASALILISGLKASSADLEISLPWWPCIPVHDTYSPTGIYISRQKDKLVIPASMRDGRNIKETIIWCCENETAPHSYA